MNYLAHAFLSFEEPDILAGNMFSDFIKGRQKFAYSEGVQKGIMLHRMIDGFTDDHPVTKEAKQYFRQAVGLYAGAFADIVYDHFLALDETQYLPEEWKAFTDRTYRQLDNFESVMPERFARMFPYMKAQNWLYNYRTITGIENSFGGLVRRAVYLDNSTAAFNIFQKNYDKLRKHYEMFFPEMKVYAREQLDKIK